MKNFETLVFPSENGCQKIFGGTFLMIYLSTTVYIDTKKVVQTLVITRRNGIFYFLVFSLHITPINSIAK